MMVEQPGFRGCCPKAKARVCAVALVALVLGSAGSGCAPVLVGGVAASMLVASDRRSPNTVLEDETLEFKGQSRLRELLGADSPAHVNLTSYNHQLLVTGEVPTDAQRQRVLGALQQLPGVRRVLNELAVMPSSALSQRSNDALLTARARAALLGQAELQSLAIKVTTERATVYLMGLVTATEAEQATQAVRAVPEVARVVRLFETISDTERQRLQRPPPTTGSGASTAPNALSPS